MSVFFLYTRFYSQMWCFRIFKNIMIVRHQVLLCCIGLFVAARVGSKLL